MEATVVVNDTKQIDMAVIWLRAALHSALGPTKGEEVMKTVPIVAAWAFWSYFNHHAPEA